MELDTRPSPASAITSISACHRVLLTPELASLVFLHVDKPAAFNATCRLFHTIASSRYSVYSWFERRFFKCEQLYQFLTWSGLHKIKYLDFLLNEKAVPCSRQLVHHIYSGQVSHISGRLARLPKPMVHSFFARFPQYFSPPGSITGHDERNVTGAIFYVDLGLPIWIQTINHTSPDRQFLSDLFERYGLPAFERDGLSSLVAAILLVGCDLEWWEATLRQYAGVSHLVPVALLDGILDRILKPRHSTFTGFLNRIHPSVPEMTTGSIPSSSFRLLEKSGGTDFWKYICRVPRMVLERPSLLFLGEIGMDADLQCLRSNLQLLERSPETFNHFIGYYLVFSAYTTTKDRAKSSIIELYLMVLKQCLGHLPAKMKNNISSVVLVTVACSDEQWGKPNHVKKILNLSQCWSIEAMALALANPTLSASEIPRVYNYFARHAPKALDLTKALQSALNLILKSNGNGLHLIEYSRTALWIRSSLEDVIRTEGASGIFRPFEIDMDPTDVVQAGVYAARYRGKLESRQSDLSTSVGLLSILNRKTSSALKIILQEARRLGEHKVAHLYEKNGVCVNEQL